MIYLVRQGQTDWNLLKKFNSYTDTELNQAGIEQAKLLAENLNCVCFDACFCSPQKRTRQTCEIIYKGLMILDDRLIEINCGEFEGTEETAESLKLFSQAISNGSMGTESFKAFLKRNCDFCDMITENHKDKNVLIVTHSLNVRIINYYFRGKPEGHDFSKSVIQNCGLLTYEN